MSQALREPIVITAPGRSGTTLLYNIMTKHPDLAWVSSWVVRMPQFPWLSAFSRLDDTPLAPLMKKIPKSPIPSEAIGFWLHFFPGYWDTDRDWTDADLKDDQRQKFLHAVETVVRFQGKKRFLTKRTGYPHFRFVRALFPNYYQIIPWRDPRPVVMSRYKQNWYFRNKPELMQTLSFKEKLDYQIDRYLKEFETYIPYLDDPTFITVHYADLVKNPVGELERICQRCNLPFTKSFRASVEALALFDGDAAWRKQAGEYVEYLEERLQEPLVRLGYATT